MKEKSGFIDAYTKDIQRYPQLTQSEETELCIQIEECEDDIWYTIAEINPIVYKFLKYGKNFSEGLIKINDIVRTIASNDVNEDEAQKDAIIAIFKKIIALYYNHKKYTGQKKDEELLKYKIDFCTLVREIKLHKKISIALYKEIVKVHKYMTECECVMEQMCRKYGVDEDVMLGITQAPFPESVEFRHDRIRYEDVYIFYEKILSRYKLSSFELEDIIWRLERDFTRIDAAKQKLVQSNLRLVLILVRRFSNDIRKIPDLIQEGNIGLMIAVDKFEYKMGTKFSTYASWWIKQSVTRASLERTIHVPLYLFEIAQKVQKYRRKYGVEENETSVEKIANDMNEPVEKLENALQITSLELTSLDQPVCDSDTMTLKDCIRDEGKNDIGREFETNLLGKEIADCLLILTPRERQIIIRRYGLDGKAPETLEEIGKAFAVTRERIRQLEVQALRKLKHPVYGHILASWFTDTFGVSFF